MTCYTILILLSHVTHYDSSLLTFLLTLHDSSSLYNDSFQVSVLLVVAVFVPYINPLKSSSIFLRLVFICLLVNTIVLSLNPCVIPLPLSFTLHQQTLEILVETVETVDIVDIIVI